jgi:hypothetical protein
VFTSATWSASTTARATRSARGVTPAAMQPVR